MTDDLINVNQATSLVPTRFRTINQAMYDYGRYRFRRYGGNGRYSPSWMNTEYFTSEEKRAFLAGVTDERLGIER